MQQYSPKNQAFLLAQMPTATDVRPFKAWKAAGRSVRKGEKALRVWIPKREGETADPAALTETERERRYVRGPVFDISQTKECAPRHRKAAETDRRHAAEFDAMDRAFAEYHAAIAADEIPADLEFADWYELREETIRYQIAKQADATAQDYTIATPAGAIIAQVEHHELYPPVGGGSQELDTSAENSDDRADRAADLLKAALFFDFESYADCIVDLLADLRHLCAREHLDYTDLDRIAADHFRAERTA